MPRDNGGLIGTWSTSAATGSWSLEDQCTYRRAGLWELIDPSFASVSLLLHMNGSNNSTTFTDSSNNALTVTANGDAKISTTQSKFGGASAYFDGVGDSVSLANTSLLQMGTGDYTVEFWLYFTSLTNYQTILDKGYTASGSLLFQTGNGNGRLIIYTNGSARITETGTAAVNTWIHYALVRSGTTLSLYRDGTLSGSTTDSSNLNNTSAMYIGNSNTTPTNYPFNGYIDDVRITKGVARYNINFTPPVSQYPDR